MRSSPRLLPILMLLALVLSTGAGCVSRMAQARLDVPTVLGIKIVGNKAFADGAIREGLAQRKTSILHFIPPFTFFQPRYYLEGTDWRDDRQRIVSFYAMRGFLDATITSSQIISGKKKRADGDPEFVRIVHTVREGAPSSVREVIIHVSGGEGISPQLESKLRSALTFKPGARFAMSDVEDGEFALVRKLQDASYARATARSVVDAYPEEHSVDITYIIEPGPKAVFGPVTVRGLDKVPERYVRQQILTKEGQPWQGSAVQKTKRGIYGMGAFTMVTLSPRVEDVEDHDEQGRVIVPIDIALRERKPRSFEYAFGFSWDTQGFTILPLNFTFGHINLGRRLVRATANIKAGYRYLSLSDHFPTAAASLEFVWPDFPVRNLSVRARGDVELGVERGYKFFTPGAAVGLGAAPLPWLKLDVSYNLSYYDILPESWRIGTLPELTSPCPEVGKVAGNCSPPTDGIAPEYDDNYLLSYVRESLIIDLRDNPLAANKGMMLQLASDQAFPFGRGADGELRGFRYVKLEAELRGYLPIVPKRLVLASRVGGAHIITWGEEHHLPVNKAVYLGGDGTVRGYRSRYLGPRAILANCTRNDCVVPLGARSGVSGSVEMRFRPVGGLWVAGFTDFGRTWGDASTESNVASETLTEYQDLLYRDGLQFSVGGGVRYDLPIGRVRLDFAARIRKWPEELATFREPFPWNIHFNLSESF